MTTKSAVASTRHRRYDFIVCGVLSLVAMCLTLAGPLRAQGSSGSAASATNLQSEPTHLELGKPIEREMRGGEKHSYKVHAEAGQFVHVVVLQKGIDVGVTLLDPSGKQILTADSENGWYGPETVSIISEHSGDLQVDVAAGSREAPEGNYQIQLTDLRAPMEADRTRIGAERAYGDGMLLYSRGGLESLTAATAKWHESFALWQSLDDKYGEALSLYSIGEVYRDLWENQKALDYFNQALPLERAVGDHAGEATTLNDVGFVYTHMGDKQKALDYYNQALPLRRAVGDRLGEARTLNNIGLIYSDLGQRQKALDYYSQALPLRRAVGDRLGEAITLNNIGLAYSYLGDGQKALDHYNQALVLERAVMDRSREAMTLSNIGGVYVGLGELKKGLDYLNQALVLRRSVGDRAAESNSLQNIGEVYLDLGETQKALDYLNQALPLERAVGFREDEATTLSDIGGAYFGLGEKQKALDYLNQALPVERAVGNRAGEARTLNNIGSVYAYMGEMQKALDCYSQALPLERAVGDRVAEAGTLNSIGRVYSDLGEKQKALDYFALSLPLSRSVQDPLLEGGNLANLMEYWKSLQNPGLAVLFGKQAIDRFQQVRRNIGELDKEARQSFLKSKEDYYRELADLLITQGRLPEAQQVLDLLKVEEYSEFTQRRGETSSGTKSVALTPKEEKSNKEYEDITADITAIGSEWMQLKSKSSRSADEEKRYSELSDELTAANQRLHAFLNNLYDRFGKGDQANARVETINEQTGGLQTLVAELGARTIALYTLVLDQKCVVMVITPATRVAREVPVSKIALRTKVFAFVDALAQHNSEEDIQSKAQDLYNILIAPISKDLQGAQAKTLVWSLDDVLRYVPLAALYDGKHYLVERYQNVVITTASVGNLKDKPRVSKWRGLAMGVSKDYDGLGQLKSVPGELDSVVRSDTAARSHGPVPGTILLDDFFTETSMEIALEQHPSLVHIASHYVFQPGDDKRSYLLLGGKETGGQGFHLTLADLRDDQRMDFKGIELFTLSGCQTGLGSNDSDGREIDGLGFTAQNKGAKAVMATLWPVEDASVGLLMAKFYRLWITTPGMTKVEALQQAQLFFLHNTAPPYRNPYFWAPFILIGNWK
ncbi:MAG: tetratricopeptide repeat protein [Candidatus Acidiferrales bacterium]